MLEHYENAVSRAYRISLGNEGILKIEYPNHMERVFLPRLIELFHKRYPQIELIIKENEQWAMADEIKNGETDIAVIFPYELERNTDICLEKMATYNICAVVNPNHRFANLSKINIEMLANETIIMMGRKQMPNVYQRFTNKFIECGVEPKKVIETKSMGSILFMVEIGLGIAFAPSYIKQVGNQNVVFLDLEDEAFMADIAIAYLRSNENPVFKLFMDMLKKERQNIIS
ncbi:MAG TPA: LysR family substrate-binding domain-containing protein [Anaerovoracaceae bacterium]|nr:LysR family substrate-binding domain-containing protein [Anaerovoracaceae bacterium]